MRGIALIVVGALLLSGCLGPDSPDNVTSPENDDRIVAAFWENHPADEGRALREEVNELAEYGQCNQLREIYDAWEQGFYFEDFTEPFLEYVYDAMGAPGCHE